jgi:hypothetical protein
MCTPTIEKYGASPAVIQWAVIRGDTGNLRIEFFDDDEVTAWDTDGWIYKATAYDPLGDFLDDLIVTPSSGYVDIKAPASLTSNWGTKYSSVVAELRFDLTVKIPATGEDTIWTPVVGTICVIGDVTPGGSL